MVLRVGGYLCVELRVLFVEKYYLVQFEEERSVAICSSEQITKSGEIVEVILGSKKYPATIEAEGRYEILLLSIQFGYRIHVFFFCDSGLFCQEA